MVRARLAGADDTPADGDRAGAAGADDTAADGEAELPAAPVLAAGVDGLLDADAATAMTTIAPAAMSPLTSLCRAGQDLRR